MNHACCQTVISEGQMIRLAVQLNQQMAMVYLFGKANFYLNIVLTEHSFWTPFLHKPSRRGKRRPWWHCGGRCPDWCYGKERDPGKMEREREKDRGLRLPLSATIDFSLSFRVHQLYLSIPSPFFPPAWAHLSIVSFCHSIPGSSLALPPTHYKNRPSLHHIMGTTTTKWTLPTQIEHWH